MPEKKRTTDIPLPNDTGEIDPRLLSRMVSGTPPPPAQPLQQAPADPGSFLARLIAFLQGQPVSTLAKRTPQIP